MSKASDMVTEKLLDLAPVRTLGLYQPYASLMLHGKIETRWVTVGRKPPFPLGWYLIYSCKKAYSEKEFKHIAGEDLAVKARVVLATDSTRFLNGYAIAYGELVSVDDFTLSQQVEAFVEINDYQLEAEYEGIDVAQADIFDSDKDHKKVPTGIILSGKKLWSLKFSNVVYVEPFEFKGKQGVGKLTVKQRFKVKNFITGARLCV